MSDQLLSSLMAKIESMEAELGAVRAEAAQQKIEINSLRSNLPPNFSSSNPRSSSVTRRKLLKSLAVVAAGTVAVVSNNQTASATADLTILGTSSASFGVYASPDGIARPAYAVHQSV
jgi:hypothetical protein